MEDYSSNEKVTPEKQRRNIMLCFLVSMYIYNRKKHLLVNEKRRCRDG